MTGNDHLGIVGFVEGLDLRVVFVEDFLEGLQLLQRGLEAHQEFGVCEPQLLVVLLGGADQIV